MNRGAGENVVELIDEQNFPCFFHILGRIISAENVENFCISHHKFATAVVLLDESLTGESTAVVFEVKLAVVNREFVKIAVNSVEELRNLTVSCFRHTGELFKTFASFNLIKGASAATVAVAEHTAGYVNNAVLTVVFAKCGYVFCVVFALVRLFAKISEDFVSAVSSPTENAVRELVCVVIEELRGHEILHARTLYNLRQCPCEAEAIGQPVNIGRNAEFLHKELSAVKKLTNESFAACNIRIGLNPSVSDNFPLTVLDLFLNPLVDIGIVLFHKVIENRLTLSKLEIGIVVHECKIVRESSCRFSCNLPDRPKPRNIKVAVTCHNDFTGGGIVNFFNLAPENIDCFRHGSDKNLAAEVIIKLMNRIVHSVEKAGFNVFVLAVLVCVPGGRDIKPIALRQPVNSDKLCLVERVFHIFCTCNRTVAEACTVDRTLNLNVELFAGFNAVFEKNFSAMNPAEVLLRADCSDDLTVDSDNGFAAEINRKINLFALKFSRNGDL